MGAALAAPAFGQQTAPQLDDLTRTMTQYSQPKANAQAPAATTAKASASEPGKHSRRSVAQPKPEKPARSGHKPVVAAAKPVSPSSEAAMSGQALAAAVRATPAPSAPKVATTIRSQPRTTPPVVAASAAPVVTSTMAPAPTSKVSVTAPVVVGQENGDAPFWRRPWSWVAGAVVLALLLVEVVGWRRHHRRKHDAKVLANIVPTVRPGDREADYHPRSSQPPDQPREFGAG
ncbi:hypothetical protein [Pinirhizobacter soli]|uniref:hypothetical protein n=1 Tax=Pinirhizobacter soli TaxID=2786953 RepID=UPI00202A447C|nr:hypothetical protein [Pinirhizobacter soli]